MNLHILTFISLFLNIVINISLLFQENSLKNSTLSFTGTFFFNNLFEKITFALILLNLFFLLIQIKFDFI